MSFWLTVTDGMAWSVCVMIVIPAKTAELIEMLFGVLSRLAPGNNTLHGGADAPVRMDKFEGEKGQPVV